MHLLSRKSQNWIPNFSREQEENAGFDRQIKEITHVPEEEFVEGGGGGPGEHEDVRPGAGLIGTSGECAVDR